MIIDKRLQMSSAQVLAAAAVSTDYIDLGSSRNIGPGEPMWLVVAARTAVTGGLTVALQTDDNAGFASPTPLVTSQTFATLAAGALVVLAVPFANEQFLRVNYTGAPVGTVDAFLTNQEPTTWTAQRDAI